VKETSENMKLPAGLRYPFDQDGWSRNFPLLVLLVSLPLTRTRTPIIFHHFWFLP